MRISITPVSLVAEEDDGSRYSEDRYHDQDIDLETQEPTPVSQEDALETALDAVLAESAADGDSSIGAADLVTRAEMAEFLGMLYDAVMYC